jgi:hypothetical protein
MLFWADLGRIFVYGDIVLPDPLVLVDLIKPLLHHDPTFLLDDACSEPEKALLLPSCRELSSRNVCMGYLRLLKNHCVLDRGLLPQLRRLGLRPDDAQTYEHLLCEAGKVFGTGRRDGPRHDHARRPTCRRRRGPDPGPCHDPDRDPCGPCPCPS